MFEIMLLAIVSIYIWQWTGNLFPKPQEKKTPEGEFGKALAKYLESGVKVKTGGKD